MEKTKLNHGFDSVHPTCKISFPVMFKIFPQCLKGTTPNLGHCNKSIKEKLSNQQKMSPHMNF